MKQRFFKKLMLISGKISNQQKQYNSTVSAVSAQYEHTLMQAQQQIAERDATIHSTPDFSFGRLSL